MIVIISLILMTCMHDLALILQRKTWIWLPLGLEGLGLAYFRKQKKAD